MTVREREEELDTQYAELVRLAGCDQAAFSQALQALGLPKDGMAVIGALAKLDALTQDVLEAGQAWLQSAESQRDDTPPQSTG